MSSNVRQRKDVPAYGRDEYVKEKKLGKKSSPKKQSWIFKSCLLALVVFSVISASVVVLFLSTPSEKFPVAYELPSPPKLEGVLARNDLLTRGTRILEGQIKGAEFLVFRNGFLYTGTADGKIVEISADHKLRVVARLGKEPCGGEENEPTCGRPLGIEFDADGYLVVCDAYLGVFRVNVSSGGVQGLISSSFQVGGHSLSFLNDLEITKDGDIYFSQSSVNYQRREHLFDFILGTPSGRLLKFDPIESEFKVVLDSINFANGLLLSTFEDYILVAETTRARILKHHIKGVSAGRTEVFADNMPCLPDNLFRDEATGSVWVACSHLRHSDKFFSLVDDLKGRTWVRRLLMELPLHSFAAHFEPGAMLLELSPDGQVIRALMDEGNKVAVRLSHVAKDDRSRFYLGSYVDDFIVVLGPRDVEAE